MNQEKREDTNFCRWIYAMVAGVCVTAMQIGVGIFEYNQRFVILMGSMQGILIFTLTFICGRIFEWLFEPIQEEEEEEDILHPTRIKVREYETAFHNLAESFLELSPLSQDTNISSRMNLLWDNQLEENRAAVALQLNEMAHIMVDTVETVFDTKTDEELQEELKRKLRKMGLEVKSLRVYEQPTKRKEVYLTVNTKRKKCVATKDVAEALSNLMDVAMMPGKDSRAFIGNEKSTILFVERTNFKTFYGIKKAIKREEQVSGDNFSIYQNGEGQLIAALSDGMGSGMRAYQESETIIELFEQFMDAGFQKETAVKMINSALVVRTESQIFSTIDIGTIDLYTGVCDFLKVGASTSFIKREYEVESVSSTSLPAGVFHRLDPDRESKKLYDGDMVIMVTDGVLDALPVTRQEEMMKDIILEHKTNNPTELADYILRRTLQYGNSKPTDDMTVLVVGLWKY